MSGSEIEALIKIMARLPGLGPRSARRAVLQLMRKRENLLNPLSDALLAARDAIVTCGTCGSIDTSDPCTICADPRRDQNVICVVEDVGDLWALERAAATRGVYHVLGGTLSALDGIGPDDLNLSGLSSRCSPETELVLAMNATVEGQSTAHFIMDMLSDRGVRISRLAHGVPVGGELDYLDDGTLAAAMRARLPMLD
ncbi:recombination mediator RecR [Alphaproteobacteria bacterium]|jgi:recombination protein RecR|nr:recombination mediator RecR [Alphaproteobacteria bacterium]